MILPLNYFILELLRGWFNSIKWIIDANYYIASLGQYKGLYIKHNILLFQFNSKTMFSRDVGYWLFDSCFVPLNYFILELLRGWVSNWSLYQPQIAILYGGRDWFKGFLDWDLELKSLYHSQYSIIPIPFKYYVFKRCWIKFDSMILPLNYFI